MKRKLIISVIIGTLIASSVVLTGCENSNNTEANTQTSQSQAINQDNSNSTQNKDNTTEDSQNKDNNTQENNSSNNKENKEASNSNENSKKTTETKNSQNAKYNASINKDPNSNKKSSNSSDKKDNNSKSSQENTKNNISNSNNGEKNKPKVSLKDLANKIADLELGGNVQYITPVKAIGSGENLSYEEDPNSSLFFCSDTKFDSKNLKYGTLVNLFGYNEKTDTYSFIVSSYEFLKNGGSGTIDHGTISSTGKIESGNLN